MIRLFHSIIPITNDNRSKSAKVQGVTVRHINVTYLYATKVNRGFT